MQQEEFVCPSSVSARQLPSTSSLWASRDSTSRRIVAKLGEGGMGTVFRGRRPFANPRPPQMVPWWAAMRAFPASCPRLNSLLLAWKRDK